MSCPEPAEQTIRNVQDAHERPPPCFPMCFPPPALACKVPYHGHVVGSVLFGSCQQDAGTHAEEEVPHLDRTQTVRRPALSYSDQLRPLMLRHSGVALNQRQTTILGGPPFLTHTYTDQLLRLFGCLISLLAATCRRDLGCILVHERDRLDRSDVCEKDITRQSAIRTYIACSTA